MPRTLVWNPFSRFDKKSEADAAVAAMNGKTPDDGTEPLIVRVAEEHGKMKAVYYAGYHAGLSNRGKGLNECTQGNESRVNV